MLETRSLQPWRVMVWVKFIEAVMQLRPRSLWRFFFHRDPAIRAAIHWYYRIGRKVWFYEIWGFLFRDHLLKQGKSLGEFWGEGEEGFPAEIRRNWKP